MGRPETTRSAKECKAMPKSPPKDGGKLVPDGELKYFSDATNVPTECGAPCFGADCYKPVPMSCCKQADKSFLKTSDWFAEKTCLDKPLATENGDIMITFTGGCSAEGEFFYGEQCGGSEFGPFKKFADALGLDLPCEQPKEKCECNAYVYTKEAGCFNVGTPPGAKERYFMMVNDPVCVRKTVETTDMPVKPTDDPKSCDCGYSKEDFEMLKEMVMKHDKALQEKEMEMNDVLSGVTYMRDTMCKMKLPGDKPYETSKMPYESTKKPYYSTKMPYETTRRGYESTRREYPETTRREYPETSRRPYPETTRREYPETTRRDYPETTRKMRPETTKMDYPETTRMGRPETTKKDYPETTKPWNASEPPWEDLNQLDQSDQNLLACLNDQRPPRWTTQKPLVMSWNQLKCGNDLDDWIPLATNAQWELHELSSLNSLLLKDVLNDVLMTNNATTQQLS